MAQKDVGSKASTVRLEPEAKNVEKWHRVGLTKSQKVKEVPPPLHKNQCSLNHPKILEKWPKVMPVGP